MKEDTKKAVAAALAAAMEGWPRNLSDEDVLNDLINKIREQTPLVFKLQKINDYIGGGPHFRSLQNLQSRGELPDGILIKDGPRKTLVCRDNFLAWWGPRLRLAKGGRHD